MKKRMLSLLAVLLLLCLPTTAFAHEVPDLSRTGSIEITMMLGEETIPGGALVCTRVGDIAGEDGNYAFRRLDGEPVEEVSAQETAQSMADFVEAYQAAHAVVTEEKNVGQDGKVKFDALEPGLYLISQKNPPSGYYAVSPFLVGVPNNEDGHYVYDVTIRAKTEPEKAPVTPPAEPEKPDEPTLPQTGQLTWPIPVLTAAGLLLLAVGYALRKGKSHHEA